jgi:hypothetical protein
VTTSEEYRTYAIEFLDAAVKAESKWERDALVLMAQDSLLAAALAKKTNRLSAKEATQAAA